MNRDTLRATAAMIQTRWPGRWEGDLARRLEQLTTRIEEGTQMNSPDTLRDHLAAAILARIKQATVSRAQPFDGLTSLLAANEYDLADTALAAVLEYLDIADAEAWCKACRRVWEGKHHRCEVGAPADRAAVLREAADIAEGVALKRHRQHEIEREQGALDVMTVLRRMVDETTAEHHTVGGVRHLCHAGDHYCPQQPEGRDLSDPPLYGAAESETRPEMNDVPLAGEELSADEAVGEPLVWCWHTEPGSPCDWDVCRQPERLAAGDPGNVPGTRHLGH